PPQHAERYGGPSPRARSVAHGAPQGNCRARARQRGVELPLVISDHADWQELIDTIRDVSPEALWVTHGSEDALVHYAKGLGIDARPLSLVGYGDDDAEVVGAEVAAGDDRGNDPETEGAA
ncbi:MAG: MBL fold metallo-hydrolase RNA specificity domain-containing protein, partial [Pseudomonadota bacterium]